MAASTTGGNVLLFDERVDEVDALCAALAPEYRVRVVADVDSAAAALAAESPDLLLFATPLAAPDDATALTRFRQDAALGSIPAILLLDSGSRALLDAVDCGAADCIERPLNMPLALARISTHIELRHCRETLLEQSHLDDLTGIANRRRFNAFFAAAFANAQRRRESLAVILFNVDQFGAYNAHYGREAGDEALVHIGRTLAAERQRPFDLVTRYEDATFACVLPDTGLEGAMVVAGLHRSDIFDLRIEHAASTVEPQLTVSLGVAAQRPEPGQSHLGLLEAASDALRRAKLAGGNRIST